LINTQHDRTFGGYLSVGLLPSKEGSFYEDKHAFIIQLDDQKIFKVNVTAKANYYYSPVLLYIGGEGDILIQDNCNQREDSYTNFPFHYYGPEGTTSRTEQTNSYLGGSF
jgi:hypothetical protein